MLWRRPISSESRNICLKNAEPETAFGTPLRLNPDVSAPGREPEASGTAALTDEVSGAGWASPIELNGLIGLPDRTGSGI
jgi:hypothetical protein